MIRFLFFLFFLFFVYLFFFYLLRILETHPCETRSWREMSHGRTPLCAISTIRWRTMSGSGLPLTKTPPSWFTPPWPVARTEENSNARSKNKDGRKKKKDQRILHASFVFVAY
jgi:hypothetical protein